MKKSEKNFLDEYSRFLDSTGRHLTYSAISTFHNFSDELSEKEKQFLKNHLDACAQCSARLRDVADVESAEMPSLRQWTSWMTTGAFRYAVAAVLVIAFAARIYFYDVKVPQKENNSRVPPAERSLSAQMPGVERFAPNGMLENFIERNVRSAQGTVLLRPKRNDTLSTPFTFRWTDEKRGELFTLTVVDNKNVEVWEDSTHSKEISFTRVLEPGLYYCKLETNGVLTQVGKFVVVRKAN